MNLKSVSGLRVSSTVILAALASTVFTVTPAAAVDCVTPASSFSGGSGSPADPYQIRSESELMAMANHLSSSFKLMNDLSLVGNTCEWEPIGNSVDKFSGSLDGDSHLISNIKITSPLLLRTGLFGETQNATLKNLNLSVVVAANTVQAASADDKWQGSGALVGYGLNTSISNVHVSGTVSGVTEVGGIAGTLERSSVTWSSSTAEVSGYSNWDVGGLVGSILANSAITDSFATGSVSGYTFTGGLVGAIWAGNSKVERSYSSGNVSGNSSTGGLIGFLASDGNSNSVVNDSFASGNVLGIAYYTGGLVGNASAPDASTPVVISNSYATGNTSGSEFVGSLIGGSDNAPANGTAITNSYAIGSAISTLNPGATSVGAIVGGAFQNPTRSQFVVTNSFWNPTDLSYSPSYELGTKSTQAAMKTYSLYLSAGWSIDDGWTPNTKWGICASGYPFLNWQYQTSTAPCLPSIKKHVAEAQVLYKKNSKTKSAAITSAFGMVVSARSTVKMTVAKSSRKICKVVGGKLVSLKRGNCELTVTVQVPKQKGKKKPKAVKVSGLVVIR